MRRLIQSDDLYLAGLLFSNVVSAILERLGKPSTEAVGDSTWQPVFGATILVIELTSILVEELLVRMCEARRESTFGSAGEKSSLYSDCFSHPRNTDNKDTVERHHNNV